MSEHDEVHERLRVMLAGYVLGGLDAEERAEVERHLADCATCRAELAEITPAARALAEVRSSGDPRRAAAPAPGLGERVLGRVEREVRRDGRRRAVRAAALTSVAAVVVGVVVVLGLRAVRPEPVPTVAAPAERVQVSAATTVRASAAIVPHTWGVEVKLHATGFTAGQRYVVVVQSADGREHEAGEFVGTGEKEMDCNLSSSVLRAQARGFEVLDTDGDVLASSRF